MSDDGTPARRARPAKAAKRTAARGNHEAEPGTDPRPKNTAADRDFIQANIEDFRHIDGSLVWSGRTTDIGSPYQLPPENLRCVRTRIIRDDDGEHVLDVDRNPLRDRCPRWAMLGADICVDHAKGSRAVMDEVRKRIAGAADRLSAAMLEMAFDKSLPAADRIRAINSLMDRGGLRAGVEVSADEDSWGRLYDRIAGKVTDDDGPGAAEAATDSPH